MQLFGKVGKFYRFGLRQEKFGKTISAGDLVFVANNGLIVMVDESDGEYIAVTRREFLDRADAINAMNTREKHPDERQRIDELVQNMLACVKEARAQGDPVDPKVQEWFRKHRPQKPARELLGPIPGSKEYFQKKNKQGGNGKKLILPPNN